MRISRALTKVQTVAPFAIAATCGAAMGLAFLLPFGNDWRSAVLGVLATVIVFDLPVCLLILIGHPPVMSFFPLLPSPEQRAFRKALQERPALDDDAFYAAFYRQTDIPAAIPVIIRRDLENYMGLDLGGIDPQDNIAIGDDELDLADVFYRLERVFKIKIPRDRWTEIDGTFDSLVKYVAQSNPRIVKDP